MNVPQLRFKGFNDVWQNYQLGDLSKVTKLAGFEFTKYVKYSNTGNIIALRGLNVKNGYLNLDDVKYIDNSDFSKLNRSKLFKGDILYTYVGTIGEHAIVTDNNKFYLAPNVALIRLNNNQYSVFYNEYFFNNHFYRKSVYPLINNAVQQALSMENIRKFKVIIPNLAEQQKIGTFFSKLDDLITKQTQKVALLKQLKRGYLQKLFPQAEQTTPQLRFKGFNEEWQCKELGSLMNVTSVKRIHMSEWRKEGVPFLRARDIVAKYNHNQITDPIYIEKSKYDEYIKISGQVKTNELLITGVGTIGIPFLIKKSDIPLYFKDGNVIWLQNEKEDGTFLYYYFSSPIFIKYLKKITGIGTVGTYTIQNAKNTPLFISSLSEQQKIGALFAKLDHLIDLQNHKLALLQELKKGYLQKMFI